jgi:hypothetical protein
METTIKEDNPKRQYIVPQAERIQIDRQISLAMDSTPPAPDDETYYSPNQEWQERC